MAISKITHLSWPFNSMNQFVLIQIEFLAKNRRKLMRHLLLYSRIILTLFVSSVTLKSNAFVIAVPGLDGSISTTKPAHIIIVGKGADMGLGFLASAHLHARKYLSLYPDNQVIIFSVNEGEDTSAPYLKNLKYTIITDENDSLNMKNIVKAIKKYQMPSLETMDIIAHNAPTYGAELEDIKTRVKPGNEKFEKLNHLFSETFYIKLHGCNSGFEVAPTQAQNLDVLVIGSLTSTSLTRPYTDGNWYYADDKMSPPEKAWSKNILLNENKSGKCTSPFCYRLMPVRSAYNGYWGSLDAGLPYYKAFCPTGQEAKCKKAMARSLINFVGFNHELNSNRSLENITKALQDLMCPSTTNIDKKNDCKNQVENIAKGTLKTFKPMWNGKNIICNLNDCEAQIKCSKILFLVPKPGSCYLNNSNDDKSLRTGVIEIQSYLEGFELLGNN